MTIGGRPGIHHGRHLFTYGGYVQESDEKKDSIQLGLLLRTCLRNYLYIMAVIVAWLPTYDEATIERSDADLTYDCVIMYTLYINITSLWHSKTAFKRGF